MEVLETWLVSADDLRWRATRGDAELYAGCGGEVFSVGDLDQQIEISPPVVLGTRAVGRHVEGDVENALPGVRARSTPVKLDMVLLVNEHRSGNEEPQDRRVRQERGTLGDLLDPAARDHHPAVTSEGVTQCRVRSDHRGEGVPVEDRDME